MTRGGRGGGLGHSNTATTCVRRLFCSKKLLIGASLFGGGVWIGGTDLVSFKGFQLKKEMLAKTEGSWRHFGTS